MFSALKRFRSHLQFFQIKSFTQVLVCEVVNLSL